MSSDVERIKEKLNIVDVIGQYVKLTPAGKHHKGLSPFTSEKTPSFFVSPDKGLYHCFSTGKGGDIFTFVQEIEGLDFQGALRLLADQAGIQLTGTFNKEEKDEKERLYHVLEEATHFFRLRFQDNGEAQEYLKKRGVEEKTIQAFSIGYAPDEWHALWDYLKNKGIKEKDALNAGVIKPGQRGVYDVFRDRVMFPLRDPAGRVVAFSGRILHPKEDSPKYVNSPETPIFNKSKILYGYDRARTSIRKHNFAIMVEGQMDLVMSHQAGFGNTVATSGTGLTLEHLSLIRRLTDNLLLVFDNDKAGWNSTLRAGQLALPMEFNLKTVVLDGGKDPADIILTDPLKWRNSVRKAEHIIDVALSKVLESTADRRKQWLEVEKMILPLVSKVANSIDQSHFLDVISRKTSIPITSLTEELIKLQHVQNESTAKPIVMDKGHIEKKLNRKEVLVEKIVGIIRWQEHEASPLCDVEDITKKLEELLPSIPEMPDATRLILEAERSYERGADLSIVIDELLYLLEEEILKEKLLICSNDLRIAESKKDEAHFDELLKEHHALSKKMEEVRANIKKLRT